MLDRRFAWHLITPLNGIPVVKQTFTCSGGIVTNLPGGRGVLDGLVALGL